MPVMAVNNENQLEQSWDYRAWSRRSAGKKLELEAVLRLLRGAGHVQDPGLAGICSRIPVDVCPAAHHAKS
jgi:hypothetical protein